MTVLSFRLRPRIGMFKKWVLHHNSSVRCSSGLMFPGARRALFLRRRSQVELQSMQ